MESASIAILLFVCLFREGGGSAHQHDDEDREKEESCLATHERREEQYRRDLPLINSGSVRRTSCSGSAVAVNLPAAARDNNWEWDPVEPILWTALDKFDLPYLVNDMNLTGGHAAEVGVYRGEYSQHLISVLQVKTLHLIDPWIPTDVYTGYDRNDDIEATKERLAPHANRVEMIRGFSHEVVDHYPDNFFDFIYLDAAHRYGDCRRDLQQWWPKLKVGGLFAGDDYSTGFVLTGKDRGYSFGCRDAVDEFAAVYNIRVYETQNWFMNQETIRQLTHVDGTKPPPNYYMLKC